MNGEEFKVIEKVIESFFANDFCPNCGDISSSHFCKVCNTSVPFSLGLKAFWVYEHKQKHNYFCK